MEATRANLEPILLVYNGRGAGLPEGTPVVETTTDDGATHRLLAVTDPAVLAEFTADLGRRTAMIADGHHRFAAYCQLRDAAHAAGHGGGPWDYGLAYCVDADAYPLQLGAIHRVIPSLPPAEAARRAAAGFTVRQLPGDGDGDLNAALAALESAGRAPSDTAFVLDGQGRYWLLTRPADRRLDAEVMRDLLLAELWGIPDSEQDVLISHDAADAVRLADSAGSAGSGSAPGTAVLCNPVPFDAVRDIAAAGEIVPRKSTSFGPKPRTGLVFRTFDE
jgi:uncharacterized protein (DUF1015 family)